MGSLINYNNTKQEVIGMVQGLIEKRGIMDNAGIYSFFLLFISILKTQMKFYKTKRQTQKSLSPGITEADAKKIEEKRKKMLEKINGLFQEIEVHAEKMRNNHNNKEGIVSENIKINVKELPLVCQAADKFVKEEITPLNEAVKKLEIKNGLLIKSFIKEQEEKNRLQEEIIKYTSPFISWLRYSGTDKEIRPGKFSKEEMGCGGDEPEIPEILEVHSFKKDLPLEDPEATQEIQLSQGEKEMFSARENAISLTL